VIGQSLVPKRGVKDNDLIDVVFKATGNGWASGSQLYTPGWLYSVYMLQRDAIRVDDARVAQPILGPAWVGKLKRSEDSETEKCEPSIRVQSCGCNVFVKIETEECWRCGPQSQASDRLSFALP
jgi:hypothetical protein